MNYILNCNTINKNRYTTNSITTTVASIFNSMNLVSVISVTTSIIRVVLFPIFSRLSDLLGRTEVYSFSAIFHIISFVILATAQNFDTIVGGRVISSIGDVGLRIMGFSLIGGQCYNVYLLLKRRRI